MSPSDLDAGREAFGIDLVDGGGVNEVHARLGGRRGVAVEVARIFLEVLAGSELRGVDEQAHHDDVAVGACRLQQGDVSRVQETHRRDEADRPAVPPGAGELLAEFEAGPGDLHRRSPVAATALVRSAIAR